MKFRDCSHNLNEDYASERWTDIFGRDQVRKNFLNIIIKEFNTYGIEYVKETKYAECNNEFTLRILKPEDWNFAQTIVSDAAKEKHFLYSYTEKTPFFSTSTTIKSIHVYKKYDIFDLQFIED